MKSYKNFIEEMARNIGDSSYSPIKSNKDVRMQYYKQSILYKHHSYPIAGNKEIEIKHGLDHDGNEVYHTNDNTKKETIHRSVIKTHAPTKKLKFEHQEQKEADRTPDDILPKEYVTNLIYDHFKKSEHPLRSSDSQYLHGHKMWRKLAHKALDDKHHVYYFDGKMLHKSNNDNINSHLDSSFGKSDIIRGVPPKINYEHRHIILSKKLLGDE
jgi:hypothetical protein